MSLSSRVRRIFAQAWRRYGRPTMSTVPPLADWTLPAGYSFDASRDGILTTAGDVFVDLDDLSGYYAGSTVYIVPVALTADLDAMQAAGIAPSGMIEVWILQDDVDTVNEAFAVSIMGQWYNILEVGRGPIGHGAGIWSKVRLQRRS